MSCVYNISFRDCDEFYIGSCQDLHNRKITHKCDYYKENNKKLYQFIRENYDWEDVIFEVLEQHDIVLDTIELRKREQHFIDELHPTLNQLRAYRTEEQIMEEKKEYDKKYYEKHKEEIIEKSNKYYEEHKHLKEVKERRKLYVANNQEKLKYRKERLQCNCGVKYLYPNKAQHEKSKKHQDYLANLNNKN